MRRRGFQLIEVLMALAIASGPLMMSFGLVLQNMRGSHFDSDHFIEEQLLDDLLDILQGQTAAELSNLAGSASAPLASLLAQRVRKMSASSRAQAEPVAAGLAGKLVCRFDDHLAGCPRLARLVIERNDGRGKSLRIARLFRVRG